MGDWKMRAVVTSTPGNGTKSEKVKVGRDKKPE